MVSAALTTGEEDLEDLAGHSLSLRVASRRGLSGARGASATDAARCLSRI